MTEFLTADHSEGWEELYTIWHILNFFPGTFARVSYSCMETEDIADIMGEIDEDTGEASCFLDLCIFKTKELERHTFKDDFSIPNPNLRSRTRKKKRGRKGLCNIVMKSSGLSGRM